MKKIFFLLVLFSVACPAQNKDTVDIRAIVQKQIDLARERDTMEQMKRDSLANVKVYYGPQPLYYGPYEEVIPVKKETLTTAKIPIAPAQENKIQQTPKENILNTKLIAEEKGTKSSNDFLLKFYILGGAAFAAFSFVFIRRKILNRTKRPDNSIKNNIKTMRNENLIKRDRPQLKSIRSKLVNSPVILNNHGKSLSSVARELNISQGEIILAAKIKSYELAKNDNSKWFLN